METKYDYLLALKVGESETIKNDRLHDRSPSTQPTYMRVGTAIRVLQSLNPGTTFALRLDAKGDCLVFRTSDGATSVPAPPKAGRGPDAGKRRTAVSVMGDIDALVANAVAKALGKPTEAPSAPKKEAKGKDYFIVTTLPYTVFAKKEEAERHAELFFANTKRKAHIIHAREVTA